MYTLKSFYAELSYKTHRKDDITRMWFAVIASMFASPQHKNRSIQVCPTSSLLRQLSKTYQSS